MTELILIRHGETDWNRELRFQGHVDVPLNTVGQEQARRLGIRLAGEAAHLLVSSDLIRTQQTALPISQQSLHPCVRDLVLDVTLREQNFGVVDGMRVEDIKVQHPDAWTQWTRFQADYAFTGGESTRQFHARVLAAVRGLAQAHMGQTLVVVTHGGVLDMIYRTALALPLSGPRQSVIPNAGLNRVRIEGEAISILDWADTQHLADMPPQPTYDQSRLVPPGSLAGVLPGVPSA
ncbi:histidine phosphatase family protein [Rhodoferax ferrireducens]|uniref:histidine phosphatase family protein n=1 Tax=Rhodoferax ferrireducens TaxID=192843 RepID=UPI000E0E0119|nr:histidine phosphatase family protein [Rhodoferax ferrireducens]